MSNNFDYLFKFILIGDSSVGKSCLLHKYVEGKFKNDHDPTLGVEFGCKNTTIDGLAIKIQIWDTAGQQSFKSITRCYYKGSIAAVLMFDITKRQSFDNINRWIQEMQIYSHQKIIITLVGNKIDLKANRAISEYEAKIFAKQKKYEYFQTSALTGQNINLVFQSQCKKILQKINNKQIDPTNQNAHGVKCGRKKQQSPLKLKSSNNSSYLKETSHNKQCKC